MQTAFDFARGVARLLGLPACERREVAFRVPPSAR